MEKKNTPAASAAPSDQSMTESQAKPAGQALQNIFRQIPNETKITLLGALLVVVGCFLPWWSQKAVGPYGTTYTINAFVDATFLLGVLVFLMSIFSIIATVFELLGKKPKFLTISHSLLQVILGSEMTLLMFIVFSIFTSPRFTVAPASISRIEAGVSWGIFVPLLGAAMVLVGGWLDYRGSDLLYRWSKKTSSDNSTESA